jgi:hypothetical protein
VRTEREGTLSLYSSTSAFLSCTKVCCCCCWSLATCLAPRAPAGDSVGADWQSWRLHWRGDSCRRFVLAEGHARVWWCYAVKCGNPYNAVIILSDVVIYNFRGAMDGNFFVFSHRPLVIPYYLVQRKRTAYRTHVLRIVPRTG